jgi:hypothetical protein
MIALIKQPSLALVCLMLFLGACKLPASHYPTLQPQSIAFTAAAETIAAQLTAIANPTDKAVGEVNPVVGVPTLSALTPSETLPATSTPLPTNTALPNNILPPPPSAQSTLLPTQTGIGPVASLGDPTWTDGFIDGVNWPLYNDMHVQMEVDSGKLRMTALIPNRENPWDGWMVSQPYLTDFYLVVTATPGECSGLDRYGLLARAAKDASRSYLFGFSCDGQYSLRIWSGTYFRTLVEWTTSQSIHPGAEQTNQLGFKAEGDKISLFANGNLLTGLENEVFSEGAFGLFVGSVNTTGFSVHFDDVAYWELP